MKKEFGYPKEEKLKQKKEITLLFEKGKWKTCGNIRVISYKISSSLNPQNSVDNPKIGFSVSKRNFKKAVDRNRIKRLLREAYRLNKRAFTERFGSNSITMIFWISKDLPKHYSEVENDFLNLCESKK